MKDEDVIISGVDVKAHSQTPFVVDFATAKLLSRSGSTCDAYECTIQHRRMFVKRLKSEFHDNPLYLSAFRKEYELGVSLTHPSLPRYVGLGDDYIVMDYVEGDTLDELIRRGDQRLSDKRWIKKLLNELIDAAEYLHNRNIVHCDIKADNIIVSPYSDRPATLIDLDKAYSPWLNDTHGNPSNYDCEDCADGAIDLRGIGKIANQLGHTRLATACQRKDVGIAMLREALAGNGKLMPIWMWGVIICIVGVCAVISVRHLSRNDQREEVSFQEPKSTDTIAKVPDVAQPITAQPLETAGTSKSDKSSVSVQSADEPDDEMKELNDFIKQQYGPLSRRHKYLRELAVDPKSTEPQLQEMITTYGRDMMQAQRCILAKAMDLYGYRTALDASAIVSKCSAWRKFMKDDYEINQLYNRELEKRKMAKDSITR